MRQLRANGRLGRQTQEKTTQGNDRHTLWRRRVGAPAKAAPPHPPTPRAHRQSQKAEAPLGGPAGHCANYSTMGGGPRKTDAERAWTGQLPQLSRPPSLTGRRAAAGPSQAWTVRVLARPSAPEPRSPRGGPRPSGCGRGQARRHMMAQRLRRNAPWKRRAACTCLQRAQPTLLSSSLKSSRMCQLYLAEHST